MQIALKMEDVVVDLLKVCLFRVFCCLESDIEDCGALESIIAEQTLHQTEAKQTCVNCLSLFTEFLTLLGYSMFIKQVTKEE